MPISAAIVCANNVRPELVHVPHERVHDGEEAEEEVEPQQVGKVKGKVVLVGQNHGKPVGKRKCSFSKLRLSVFRFSTVVLASSNCLIRLSTNS